MGSPIATNVASRCWSGGRWVPVAGAVPCAFEGFGEWEFFSHLWGDEYRVTEASTGYGVEGSDDWSETSTYPTRGGAIDAAEAMLRKFGAALFGDAVASVLAGRAA